MNLYIKYGYPLVSRPMHASSSSLSVYPTGASTCHVNLSALCQILPSAMSRLFVAGHARNLLFNTCSCTMCERACASRS